MAAKKKLLQDSSCKNVFVNEHLTAEAGRLFKTARGLARSGAIQGAWTWNGRVYVKSNRGNKHLVSEESDFSKL